MPLNESGEMYLESILVLSRQKAHVRSVDIAEHMGFSKPSISRAVGLLKNGGFIEIDNDGYITLTDIGNDTANKIFERHHILSKALQAIGVSEEVAINDACKIEHVISSETFDAIKAHYNKSK